MNEIDAESVVSRHLPSTDPQLSETTDPHLEESLASEPMKTAIITGDEETQREREIREEINRPDTYIHPSSFIIKFSLLIYFIISIVNYLESLLPTSSSNEGQQNVPQTDEMPEKGNWS